MDEDAPKPIVFGEEFDKPKTHKEPNKDGELVEGPLHYDKHVWLWQANPKDFNDETGGSALSIFKQWNATIKQL